MCRDKRAEIPGVHLVDLIHDQGQKLAGLMGGVGIEALDPLLGLRRHGPPGFAAGERAGEVGGRRCSTQGTPQVAGHRTAGTVTPCRHLGRAAAASGLSGAVPDKPRYWCSAGIGTNPAVRTRSPSPPFASAGAGSPITGQQLLGAGSPRKRASR